MPDVFIIMGKTKTKKSATIRALTGVFHGKDWKVATQNETIDIFVQVRALQEAKISPKNFIRQRNGSLNILVCLWISKGNGQPDGDTYIKAFLKARWNIKEIVVLGTEKLPYDLPQDTPKPKFIHDSQNRPANWIASQVRGWWRWL